MSGRETIQELVADIAAEEIDSLTPFEYFLLKDYLKLFKPLIDEFEQGLRDLRIKAAVGDQIVYRGQSYLVRRMRDSTNWKKAYTLALSHCPEVVIDAIDDTVQTELTKEVTTVEPVY